MTDKLFPRTWIERGPLGEEAIGLDQLDPEILPEGAGDTSANDIDTNVGGASSTAGLDSGGAVGVRRGRSVGRPGYEYESVRRGETTEDIESSADEEQSDLGVNMPPWADPRLPR